MIRNVVCMHVSHVRLAHKPDNFVISMSYMRHDKNNILSSRRLIATMYYLPKVRKSLRFLSKLRCDRLDGL